MNKYQHKSMYICITLITYNVHLIKIKIKIYIDYYTKYKQY